MAKLIPIRRELLGWSLKEVASNYGFGFWKAFIKQEPESSTLFDLDLLKV